MESHGSMLLKGQTVPGTLAPLNHYRSNLRLWKHRASLAVEPVPEAVKEARRSRIMSDERPGTRDFHWDYRGLDYYKVVLYSMVIP